MQENSNLKISMLRIGLLAAATAIILAIMPRVDHQSYSYEENQPWKYPLLTAEFDMPVMRDSVSAKALRDSLNKSFIPFVMRQPNVARSNVEKFVSVASPHASAKEVALLSRLLSNVYQNGVVETSLYDAISRRNSPKLRMAETDNGGVAVTTLDASAMRSPAKAFQLIDSLYQVTTNGTYGGSHLSSEMVKALNICIVPNVLTDSVSDSRFREQEYLTVNGALGVIKKGQRIVDRGEIVTPQIYTNLNTYMEMLQRTQGETAGHTYFIIGQALYLIICFSLLYLFLGIYRPVFFSDLRKMTFLMAFITLFAIFAIIMFEYVPNGLAMVPFAAVPVIIMVFFDSRTAIFSLFCSVLISALIATFPFNFIFLQISAGLVATFSIHQLSRRSQLLRTAAMTFGVYTICTVAIFLVTEGTISGFSWRLIGVFAINAVILSFAYVLILVIEKIFGFTSTVTLVELSDINSPLLRRLAEEAPGTFQHSVQVSTLATEAARAIGANSTLVRTGALYHDIGKMESPIFFTENQHGVNPHAGLNPETSAQKIISHVTAGLSLANKEKLPAVVRNFITEHHGKGVTRYFYNTALNEAPDGNVDIEKFRYPGPNPQSRETAILMMADSVEAASRSLKDYSAESINSLVDKIVDTQAADGLFSDSPISFKDVQTIKDTFKKRLATIYHSRVAYPEVNKKSAENNDSPQS